MKEYVLQLIEELMGAHNYGAKRSKADEIAALVKTAVFPADQADETEKETSLEPWPPARKPSDPVFSIGEVSANIKSFSSQPDVLTKAEFSRVSAAIAMSEQQSQQEVKQAADQQAAAAQSEVHQD